MKTRLLQTLFLTLMLSYVSPVSPSDSIYNINVHLPTQPTSETIIQPDNPEKKSWVDISQEAKDCVVQIFSYIGVYNLLEPFKTPDQMESRGSGFFINEQGDILTNFHVIDQSIATYIQIPSLGKDRFKVEFVGANPERDFAKLRPTPQALEQIKQKLDVKTLPYLHLADSDTLTEAQEIMAMGYPLGEENLKVSIGRFAGRESTEIGECIQTTAPINAGNSGGPFLDQQGNVVGIATIKAVGSDVEGVAYLIPINNVKIMIDFMTNKNIVKNPFWGIILIPTTTHTLTFLGNPVDGGVYIPEVKTGSLGEEYGIQAGDVFYQVNGKQIDHYGYLDVSWSTAKVHVKDFISRLEFGSIASLVLYRQGEKVELSCEVKNSDAFEIQTHYPWIYTPLDFEILGGMVVTPLTINHVKFFQELKMRSHNPNVDISAIEKYKEEDERLEPRLIITTIYPSSLFHETRCFKSGDRIISEVNGISVSTPEDFRAAIIQNKDNKYLTIKTEEGSFAAIPLKQALQEEDVLAQHYSYQKTPFVQMLQKDLL